MSPEEKVKFISEALADLVSSGAHILGSSLEAIMDDPLYEAVHNVAAVIARTAPSLPVAEAKLLATLTNWNVAMEGMRRYLGARGVNPPPEHPILEFNEVV